MSIKINLGEYKPNIKWDRVIHKTLHISQWWIIISLAFSFIIAFEGEDKAVRLVGVMLGFYLLGIVLDTLWGGFFEDDNDPPDMNALSRFLSKLDDRSAERQKAVRLKRQKMLVADPEGYYSVAMVEFVTIEICMVMVIGLVTFIFFSIMHSVAPDVQAVGLVPLLCSAFPIGLLFVMPTVPRLKARAERLKQQGITAD